MGQQPLFALLTFALLTGQVSAESSIASSRTFIPESKLGQWKASKLLGLKIYNGNNENIGQIAELLLDKSGKIEAVVISAGGFLGVGKHDIAVPLGEIKSPSRSVTKDISKNSQPEDRVKRDTSPVNAKNAAAQEDVGTPAYGILEISVEELKAAPEFKMLQ